MSATATKFSVGPPADRVEEDDMVNMPVTAANNVAGKDVMELRQRRLERFNSVPVTSGNSNVSIPSNDESKSRTEEDDQMQAN